MPASLLGAGATGTMSGVGARRRMRADRYAGPSDGAVATSALERDMAPLCMGAGGRVESRGPEGPQRGGCLSFTTVPSA